MTTHGIVTDETRPARVMTRDIMDSATYSQLLETLFSLPRDAERIVYFFGADDGPIKIGYTKMPIRREQMLRAEHRPDGRFLATVRGGSTVERAYHMKFEHLRIEGEWFERHPDILAEIASLSPQPLEVVS